MTVISLQRKTSYLTTSKAVTLVVYRYVAVQQHNSSNRENMHVADCNLYVGVANYGLSQWGQAQGKTKIT